MITYIAGSLAWPNQFLTLHLQAHTQAGGYQNGAAFLHYRPTFYNRLYKYLFCLKNIICSKTLFNYIKVVGLQSQAIIFCVHHCSRFIFLFFLIFFTFLHSEFQIHLRSIQLFLNKQTTQFTCFFLVVLFIKIIINKCTHNYELDKCYRYVLLCTNKCLSTYMCKIQN